MATFVGSDEANDSIFTVETWVPEELYKNEHMDGGNSQFVQKLHQGEQPVNSLKKVEK